MLLLLWTASQLVLEAGVVGKVVCQGVLLLHLLGHNLAGECVERRGIAEPLLWWWLLLLMLLVASKTGWGRL